MAEFTIQEIYNGKKYNILNDATKEFITHGKPSQLCERTWLDMLIVKHSISVAEKMLKEGDSVSGMFDNESSSSYVSWEDTSDEND